MCTIGLAFVAIGLPPNSICAVRSSCSRRDAELGADVARERARGLHDARLEFPPAAILRSSCRIRLSICGMESGMSRMISVFERSMAITSPRADRKRLSGVTSSLALA